MTLKYSDIKTELEQCEAKLETVHEAVNHIGSLTQLAERVLIAKTKVSHLLRDFSIEKKSWTDQKELME